MRYIKRGAEPTDDLRNQIRNVISDVVLTARRRVRQFWNYNKSEAIRKAGNFGKAEETMAKAGELLPMSKKGRELSNEEAEQRLDKLVSAILGEERNDTDKKEKKRRVSGKSRIPLN